MPESRNAMPCPDNILIAYASRLGSTAEVAQAIADEIGADARWIGSIDSLTGYDAVIIGSAIRYDKWLPEATDFVNTHHEALKTMPVAMFLTCLTLSHQSPKARQQAARYAENIAATLPQVHPADIGRFAGVLDYGKIPYPSRLLARLIFAVLRVPEGDYRDWQAIRAWARTALPRD